MRNKRADTEEILLTEWIEDQNAQNLTSVFLRLFVANNFWRLSVE